MWWVFRRVLLVLLLIPIAVEVTLYVGGLLSEDRSGAGDAADRIRILCLGESHTWGAFVEDDEAYPAQLQAHLNASDPDGYAVINLGVPGMNAAQLRRRLAENILRYSPSVVVIWIGSNDGWNDAEFGTEQTGFWQQLERYALQLRSYRMLRLWQHERRLESDLETARTDGIHQPYSRKEGKDGGAVWTLGRAGTSETIENRHDDTLPEGERQDRLYRELMQIDAWLREAGIPVVFIRYPLNVGGFWKANLAVDRLALETGVPMVDASKAWLRMPAEDVEWLWGAHPNAAVYSEIARDVAAAVREITGKESN